MESDEIWEAPLPDTRIRQPDAIYASFAKNAVDLTVAAVLLVSCFPLICLAALAIMLESRGSPIYQQERVGWNGRAFTLYKLRTMFAGSEVSGCRTEPQDARVTRIGMFLRNTKIDELPQLFNVLRREMSLIGPRPLSVDETQHLIAVEGFSTTTPGLTPGVLPGLTGLEQCTRSSLHSYEHRFWLNKYYEDNVCVWLDLWIIRRTLLVCPLVCSLAGLSTAVLPTLIVVLLMR